MKNTKKAKQLSSYKYGGSVQDLIGDYIALNNQRQNNLPNQIENPNAALSDNTVRINKAAYKAENNPFVKGMELFGNYALQTGINSMGKSLSFATGGVAIEAEGGEVLETPDGIVKQLKGASHEKGGINIKVPNGTEIFSKRLKGPDGKSMAQRKKERQRQLLKLQKLEEKNPTDKTLQKTVEKTNKDFALQELEDIQQMETMRNILQKKQKFATGGIAENDLTQDPTLFQKIKNLFAPLERTSTIAPINQGDIALKKATTENFGSSTNPAVTQEQKLLNIITKGKNISKQVGELSSGMTLGDVGGIMGQLYSTFAPMENTQANRNSDTPNINYMRDFGKTAMTKMDMAKQYTNQARDQQLQDLGLARAGQMSNLKNSAMGINTQRALQLATDANVNNSKNAIYGQANAMMQNLFAQEAQLANVRDQAVMTGETARDTADRMDKDAYFNNLATDIASKGKGFQTLSKTANSIQERNVKGDILNNMFVNFGVNGMTGEIKSKAVQELSANTGNYYNASPELLKGVLNKKYKRKGDKFYNTEGQEIDKKTLEIIS